MTKDPILFAGRSPNLYSYVNNDPINFADPFGLTQEQVDNAMAWLRINAPQLFRNNGNVVARDFWVPGREGLTLGNLILIDTGKLQTQDMIVKTVAHELIHARDGFLTTIGNTDARHLDIDLEASDIANLYENSTKNRENPCP